LSLDMSLTKNFKSTCDNFHLEFRELSLNLCLNSFENCKLIF
jgi:hypothetical protein